MDPLVGHNLGQHARDFSTADPAGVGFLRRVGFSARLLKEWLARLIRVAEKGLRFAGIWGRRLFGRSSGGPSPSVERVDQDAGSSGVGLASATWDDHPLRIEMETPSDLDSLDRIRYFVQSVCRKLVHPPMSRDGTSKLVLAVCEAATNVVRHTYRGRPDGKIRFEAEAGQRHVAIRIRHRGEPFEPKSADEPVPGQPREEGVGLELISHYVDDVRCGTDDDGSHWISLVTNLSEENDE